MFKYILSVVILSFTSFSVIADEIGTPEQTWNAYLNAMKSGNKDLAIDALTMQALRQYKPYIEKLSADDMSKLVEGLSYEFSGESKYSNSEFRQFELCQAINDHKECFPVAFHCKSNVCKISTL